MLTIVWTEAISHHKGNILRWPEINISLQVGQPYVRLTAIHYSASQKSCTPFGMSFGVNSEVVHPLLVE